MATGLSSTAAWVGGWLLLRADWLSTPPSAQTEEGLQDSDVEQEGKHPKQACSQGSVVLFLFS